MFVISSASFLVKSFQPSLMFVGEAKSLPQSGVSKKCPTWVGGREG